MQCNGRGGSKVRSRLTLVDQLQFVKIRYPGLGQLAQASESENANAYGNENANVNVTLTLSELSFFGQVGYRAHSTS